jgi:hypothetical protein
VVAPPPPRTADCGMRRMLLRRTSAAALTAASTLALGLAGCCELQSCAEDIPTGPVRFFEALLTGANVVPPVTTSASGSARLELVGNDAYIHYDLTVANLTDSSAARLHVGAVGANGPSRRLLCSPCRVVGANVVAGGTEPVDAAFVTQLSAFGAYLEITTAAGPVLRGQLRVIAQ